ncbi:hypothetical protein P8A24_08795 [Arcanobacterium wilhelmae]|uniref:hypothetical protein n=1 Tax=Arcanobacterium wilhelmae TaxID=1803177 RepID=UPI0024153F8F|nr:hypothetical protein [Arcanobacterium wilhelmae]WFN90265.1 hypothetical protein P8A24_08795 [Arcanobacterium wilhelmae]
MSNEFAQPGDRIAERFDLVYPIEHTLGSSEGVSVWIARDTILSRSLRAILVRHGAAHAAEVADAARRSALITDPHLVSTISVIDTDSLTAIFTEVPPGIPFSSYLDGTPVDPRIVWALMGEVATTVNNIRHRGVRHLRLDASDILIQDASGVVVDGFGIQAALNDVDISVPWEDLDARETRGLIDLAAALLLGRNVGDPQASIEHALEVEGLPEPLRQVLLMSSEGKTPADFVRTLVPWPELDTSSLTIINEPSDFGTRRPVPPATSSDADRPTFNAGKVAFPPLNSAQPEPEPEPSGPADDGAHAAESGEADDLAVSGAAGAAAVAGAAAAGAASNAAGAPASSKEEAAKAVEEAFGIDDAGSVSNVKWPKPDGEEFSASSVGEPGAAASLANLGALGTDPNFVSPVPLAEPEEETEPAAQPEEPAAQPEEPAAQPEEPAPATEAPKAAEPEPVSESDPEPADESTPEPTTVLPAVPPTAPGSATPATQLHAVSKSEPTTAQAPTRREIGTDEQPVVVPEHRGREHSSVTRRSAFDPKRSGHGPSHGVVAGTSSANAVGELVPPRRFNPSKIVVGVFAVGVVLAAVWATASIFRPLDPVAPASGPSYPSLNSPSAPASAAPESSAPAPTVAPQITSADVKVIGFEKFQGAPQTDINNVSGIGAVFDGNPQTRWRSWWFSSQEMKPADSTVIILQLKEKATVSEVTIDEAGNGGNIEWLGVVPDKPADGTIIAQGALNGTTTLKVKEPVETDSITLRVTKLPQDSKGKFRLDIAEITVK